MSTNQFQFSDHENDSDSESKSQIKINVENVITNLKIISNLKPNDKLTIKNSLLSIDTPYYSQGMYRWWNQDSRTNTMIELEKIINDTFSIIDDIYSAELHEKTGGKNLESKYYKNSLPQTYFQNENSQQLQTFSSELTNTIKGLQNLKLTYRKDISICSKIDVMIEKINIRIKKINQLLTIKPSESE
jgi:hypothetical protein